jgi:hypothetical protein
MMPVPRIPSLEESHVLVRRSLEEGIPIDRLVCAALFPVRVPKMYRDWPQAAVDAWHAIMAIYDCERAHRPTPQPIRTGKNGRPSLYAPVTLCRAWQVVTESAALPDPRRLSWSDIAARLSCPRNVAQHQLLTRLGFAFQGRAEVRRLVMGPCVRCGLRLHVDQLAKDHSCHHCNAEQAA